MPRIPLTVQLLLALLVGLAAGLGVNAAGVDQLPRTMAVIGALDVVGVLWLNAIRMTVIPLVVTALIVGVSGAPNAQSVGRLGARSLVVFLAMLTLAAVAGVLIGAPLMSQLAPDAATIDALRAQSASSAWAATAPSPTTLAEWLTNLVPVNPVKAAADGAMLPLIVFAVAFGAALIGVAPDRRMAVVQVCEGIRDASLVLVRWILRVAPIGVFVLALGVASRLGLEAVGPLAAYVGLVAALCVGFWIFGLAPIVVVFGRVPLRPFVKAAFPALSIAFGSRSSLAALPAMLEAARALKLPEHVTSFFVPLAASMFRCGAGIGLTTGAVFIAALYGVDLSVTQLVSIALTTVITSFSVPGIPGGFMVAMMPVLAAAGLPAEGLGLLMGVEAIPDMFRTTTNVSGQLVAATVVARGDIAATPNDG